MASVERPVCDGDSSSMYCQLFYSCSSILHQNGLMTNVIVAVNPIVGDNPQNAGAEGRRLFGSE